MYDLNIRSRSIRPKDQQLFIQHMMSLGWDIIAWNVNAFGKLSQGSAKPHNIVNLEKSQLEEALRNRKLLQQPSKPSSLRQFTRITVAVDELPDAQALHINNEFLKPFDIIAATPGNQKVFTYLCETADIDIISIDFRHKTFILNKKTIDIAVARGIVFEICYSPLFSAPNVRGNVISNTKVLFQYLRGKHIILSSGAETLEDIRGIYDARNLIKILNLNDEKASDCINKNCISVLKHAASRKLRYLGVEVLKSKEFQDRWPEINFINERTNQNGPLAEVNKDEVTIAPNSSDSDGNVLEENNRRTRSESSEDEDDEGDDDSENIILPKSGLDDDNDNGFISLGPITSQINSKNNTPKEDRLPNSKINIHSKFISKSKFKYKSRNKFVKNSNSNKLSSK